MVSAPAPLAAVVGGAFAVFGDPRSLVATASVACLFFVLDGLLSCVILLCELEFAVHSREHLALFKWRINSFIILNRPPTLLRLWGWSTF